MSDVETRTCITCGKTKPITEFVINERSGNYQNKCKECYKAYHRAYYEKRLAENANKVVEVDPNATKVCNKCGVEKPLTEFSFNVVSGKFINTCKACKCLVTRKNYEQNKDARKEYAKAYALEHQEEIKARRKEYYDAHAEQARAYSRQYEKDHADEVRVKRKAYRQAHKDEFRERDKQYYETHKEQIAKRYKEWAKDHAEQLAEYNKRYRAENAEEISRKRKIKDKENRKRITAYYLNKRDTDPLFRVSTQVRGLIRISLKKRGYGKDTHTYEILGCDYETLWEHLKKTWKKRYGTEWNGEDYHVDHKTPLATAKTKQDVIDLCHYTNLQMLKPKDNLVKNKYLDWELDKGGDSE